MPLFDIKKHKMVCSKGDFTDVYSVQQINGQLIATFKHVSQPKRGTEVFIKKLPRNILLEEIFEFAIRCGDIFRIRLLMDFSGYNRGYCFVTYFEVSSARKAILTLNGDKIKGDGCVYVKMSFDNNKLEMRGIPHGINREEIFNVMSEIIGNGLTGIITFKKANNVTFTKKCVLKYDSHRHALEARKKVWPTIKLWRKNVEIDWAVPHEVLNQSKRLYFQNAPKETTKLQLYEEVTKYIDPSKMLNMFLQQGLGYLLFVNGADAFDAYLKLRVQKICGEILEFSFTRFYDSLQDEDKTGVSEGEDLSDTSSEKTLSDNDKSSSKQDSWWDKTSSSTESERVVERTSLDGCTSSTIESPIDNMPQPSDLIQESSSYNYDTPAEGESQWLVQPEQYSGNVFPAANRYAMENIAGGINPEFVNYYPTAVVPTPIITLSGSCNVAAEIHHCVSHYFNFNLPAIRWVYTCTNNRTLTPSVSFAPYNTYRVMPTINHIQYDLTLYQVPRMPEYHF